MRTPVLLALLMVPLVAQAQQSPLGRWKTVDDATGKPRGVVEIYRASDGRYAGRVVGILDTSNGPNPVCNKCEGERKGKPILGMTTLWGLTPSGTGKWSGGHVLDPDNGRIYKSKLELLDGGRKLGMSGCIAFLCRQQVWLRQ